MEKISFPEIGTFIKYFWKKFVISAGVFMRKKMETISFREIGTYIRVEQKNIFGEFCYFCRSFHKEKLKGISLCEIGTFIRVCMSKKKFRPNW